MQQLRDAFLLDLNDVKKDFLRNPIVQQNRNVEYGTEIIKGIRDYRFPTLINNFLNRSPKLSSELIGLMLSPKYFRLYEQSFTASSADPIFNYENWEQLGDVTLNKILVWHFFRKFEHLQNPNGVKNIARLRINYGSKQVLSSIAESLNFWGFISANEETLAKRKIHLLEDVFEAIIGVSEWILDDILGIGNGFEYINEVVISIFEELSISSDLNVLTDDVTKLKEFFDKNSSLGTLLYKDGKNDDIVKVRVYRVINDIEILMGTGLSTTKGEARQKAAKQALIFLEKMRR